jgi:L-ribulose-5-phosphate 3-epimerase
MNGPMLRRQFLVAAGGTAIAAPGVANVFATRNAAEADQTGNQARLFAGCCAYSYQKYFNAGSMTMESFIQKAVDLGVQGVDITTYWLKSTEPEYLTSLRHLAFKNGMSLSGIAIRTEMCQAGGAIRAEETHRIQQWVDSAELLGAPHVRVFCRESSQWRQRKAGNRVGGRSDETCVRLCRQARHYSTLGIENHGGMTARASTTVEILRRVDSPYAGINLDISNFAGKTDDEMYSDIRACVPFATHAHPRSFWGNKAADRLGPCLAAFRSRWIQGIHVRGI